MELHSPQHNPGGPCPSTGWKDHPRTWLPCAVSQISARRRYRLPDDTRHTPSPRFASPCALDSQNLFAVPLKSDHASNVLVSGKGEYLTLQPYSRSNKESPTQRSTHASCRRPTRHSESKMPGGRASWLTSTPFLYVSVSIYAHRLVPSTGFFWCPRKPGGQIIRLDMLNARSQHEYVAS